MHQALFVLEILVEIFSHLNPIPSDESRTGLSQSRKSLAALARTCKTFYDPAMDLLWAILDDVWPLLGCVTRLHSSIYYHRPRSDYEFRYYYHGLKVSEYSHARSELKYSLSTQTQFSLSPPDAVLFSEHEARQFLRHAARVRSLSVYTSYILWFLNSDFPIETCLFPRLISLSWKVHLPQDNRLLHLFLSPTLRHCYLATDNCDWKSITTNCATLETLSIMSSSVVLEAGLVPEAVAIPEAGVISRLSDTIRSCNRLVKLCCPLLDSAAWNHISNLPTLVSLEINRPGANTQLLDRDDLNLAPFLNLTDLSLSLRSPSTDAVDIMTLIQHSEFPSLKKFELRSYHSVPWAQVEQILRALSQCKTCQTLRHVSIRFNDHRHSVDNPLPMIRHFLCFTQLRHLSLFFNNGPIDLDNDLLLEAVSSWPHIEVLNFENRRQSAVTFRGLFAALRLCPRLHTLRIWMDAANIDIDPEAESFQHQSLRALDFTWSNIGDAKAVAVIIASMLPSVSKVTHMIDDGRWEDVNLYLQSFHLSLPPPQISRAVPKNLVHPYD